MHRLVHVIKNNSPWLLLVAIIILSLIQIYRNDIVRAMHPGVPADFRAVIDEVSIEVSPVRTVSHRRKMRMVKVSLPFERTPKGCEGVYAVAVMTFSAPEHHRSGMYSQLERRFLIRFRYDLKNKRCESKDISLEESDLPDALLLQIIDVEVAPDRIKETPRPRIVEVTLQQPMSESRAGFLSAAGYPFVTERSTERMPSHSLDLPERDVELMIGPYDSVRDVLLREFATRTADCRLQRGCAPIQVAVAEILDSELIQAIDRAQEAGLPIEIITNSTPRSGDFGQHSTIRYHRRYAPLEWLPGNRFFFPTETKLPMHAKFVIFGDDLVISMNPSFSFENFPTSREISLVYRNRKVVGIFQELFALIRSGAVTPLRVNLKDSAVFLLNADRPRGTAVGHRKPELLYRGEDGRIGNAYGVLYEIIDRTSGPLRLTMSPLTSSCSTYRRKHCLFDLLASRSENPGIELFLNGYFYPGAVARLADRNGDKGMAPPERDRWGSFTELQKLVRRPGDLHLFLTKGLTYSAHHERYGILGSNTLLFGSANYARLSTVNTIEVLRLPFLAQRLLQELETYREPYFAVQTGAGCKYVHEEDLLRTSPAHKRSISVSTVRANFALRSGRPSEDLEVVEPDQAGGLVSRRLTEPFESLSSYLCVREASAQDSEALAVRAF